MKTWITILVLMMLAFTMTGLSYPPVHCPVLKCSANALPQQDDDNQKDGLSIWQWTGIAGLLAMIAGVCVTFPLLERSGDDDDCADIPYSNAAPVPEPVTFWLIGGGMLFIISRKNNFLSVKKGGQNGKVNTKRI